MKELEKDLDFLSRVRDDHVMIHWYLSKVQGVIST